jgi:hypothetical protein
MITHPSANACPIAEIAGIPELYMGIHRTAITTANIVAKIATVHVAIFLSLFVYSFTLASSLLILQNILASISKTRDYIFPTFSAQIHMFSSSDIASSLSKLPVIMVMISPRSRK